MATYGGHGVLPIVDGAFIGLQNARVPLYIVLAINLTNIVLDLVFVLLLGMDVDGVAAASVIAIGQLQ